MKPIAVVHWIEKGEERSKPFYKQTDLDRFRLILAAKRRVSWTCLCNPYTVNVPKRGFKTALEDVSISGR